MSYQLENEYQQAKFGAAFEILLVDWLGRKISAISGTAPVKREEFDKAADLILATGRIMGNVGGRVEERMKLGLPVTLEAINEITADIQNWRVAEKFQRDPLYHALLAQVAGIAEEAFDITVNDRPLPEHNISKHGIAR